MTTANELISQAAGLLGVRSSADPVRGAEAAIMLERLNTMLDAWRVNSLFAYATLAVTGTLPANTQTRTIGPAGQLVVSPRPIRIESGSTYSAGGLDYPIEPVTEAEFNAIALKSVGGLGPAVMHYDPSLPAGVVNFYPRASSAVALSMIVMVQITEFANLTTDYTLPPGYRRAITFSLAEECATDFERDVPPTVARTARNARRAIQLANHSVPQLMPAVRPGRLARFLEG